MGTRVEFPDVERVKRPVAIVSINNERVLVDVINESIVVVVAPGTYS